jgi:hypothetical protein
MDSIGNIYEVAPVGAQKTGDIFGNNFPVVFPIKNNAPINFRNHKPLKNIYVSKWVVEFFYNLVIKIGFFYAFHGTKVALAIFRLKNNRLT